MRKTLFSILALLCAVLTHAQLTGTKTIPGDYATITAAVTDLNASGVGAGGVTFNVAAGYTENITAPVLITATGTATDPIVFQKSGAGANPLITRTDAGTLTTSTLGGQGDAVIIIQGSDYLAFDGISVSTSVQGVEYGYYLRKAGVTDGCKNISIRNAVITMTKGTSAYVAGIYSSNNDAASLVSSATGITITSTGGRNENVTIAGNTIQNVFTGILLRGYNGSTPYDLYDQNFTIGGASGEGNTIQNYGGNTASTSYGVYLIYHNNPLISYNTINNTAGGGSAFTTTGYGVFHSTATNSNGTYSNNTLTLSSTTGQLRGIMAGTSGISTLIANNNTITLSQAGTSEATCIYLGSVSAGSAVTVSGNTFSYATFGSTTTSYMIYASNAASNVTANGNQTSGTITKTGAGTFYGYYNFGSPTSGTATISSNNFSNISLTGASTFYGIYQATSTTQVEKILDNTISNITAGTNAVFGIHHNYGAAGSEVSGNSVSGITGAGAVNGIQLGNSTASLGLNVFNNVVSGLSGSGTGTVAGMLHVSGAANNIYKNKIYDIQNTNAGGAAYGIQVSGGTLVTVYNNLVGDIRTTTANAAVPLAGIYVSGGTTVNLFFNSVYLNATSSGALFGSAALYASSTPTVTAKNNIFVNLSTANGAGFTSAYRRTSTTLTTYGSGSDNNLFYAGTPSASNLIFYDGTNADQTLAAYKARVASRDGNAVTENPSFLSTTGSSVDFLHVNPAVPTQIESGAVTVAGITDDFDGDTRNGSTPDIGADEGSFALLDINPPLISYTALGFTCAGTDRTLTASISDPSGVPTSGAGLPVLYWKINSGAYTAVTGVWVSGNNYDFTFGNGAVTGDVVSYYIVAQDNAGTPNVGAYPATGAGGYTANPPAAATAPTTASSYPISAVLNGTYTVGAGQTFTTLTEAVNVYNTSCIGGPVVFELTDASYSAGETFPVVINANSYASSTNTLTIRPATGVTATISGSLASNSLIKVLGSYVTIDGSNNGGTSRDLTITNTSTTSPIVLLIGSTGTTPVTNVAVKNTTIINGVNTASAVVVSDGAAAGSAGYFNTITLQHNSIQKTYMGMYVNATVATGNGSGLLINGNDLNATGANAIAYTGIYVQGADGAVVTNNNIGGFDGTGSQDDNGIWLASGTVNTTVSGNQISGLNYTGTSGYGAHGIYITTGVTGSGIKVFNNTISNLSGDGWSYTSVPLDNPVGIAISGTQTGVEVYFNTISLYGNTLNQSSAMSMGIYLGTGSVANIRNNIVVNNLGLLSATGYGAAGVYAATSNAQFAAIDNNDYYVSPTGTGNKYIGQIASTGTASLATWATATGGDLKSLNYQPAFVSNTDLHLQTTAGSNWCLESAGTPIAGITTDIDADTRNTTKPDIGADEFAATGFTVTSPAAVCAPATVDLTAAAVTAGSMGGLSFGYFSDEACTVAVATPGAVNTAGTYYIKATSGSCFLVLPVTVTLNAQPAVYTVTGGGTSCSGSSVAIGLGNSETGVDYQLILDGTTNIGSPVSGTGAAFSFGTFSTAGTYTVTATNATTGCTSAMTGSAVITSATAPAAFNVTGGGTACGTDGVSVGLSGSETGVNYQLVLDGTTNVGAPVSGTGSALDFGLFTTGGTYTVVATNTTSGCESTMTGSAIVVAGAKPVIGIVLTQPNNCNSNNGGAALTITGGAGPYTFFWTGAGIIQGVQDQTTLRVGPYSVLVTAANGCQETASFTLVGPGGCDVCPTIGTLATTPATEVCAGSTFALDATGLADMGNTYGIEFKYSSTVLADPYTGGTTLATVDNASLTAGGTAAAANGSIATAGNYYVYAILSPAPVDPGCRPFKQLSLTVNAIPAATATPASQTVCSGTAITSIVLSGPVSGTSFDWTRDNTAAVTGIAASGSGDISGTLTNTTTAPVTVTFTITPSANGCTGTPVTATVTVNPTPAGTASPASQTVCSGTAISTITFSGPVSGTAYNWTRDNTVSVTGIAASGAGTISGSLTNTTSAPVTVTFTITPVANGCSGTSFTAAVLVNPTPVVIATPSTQTLCTGTAITTISFSGTVSGTTYNWTRDNTSNVTGIAASGSGNISGTVTNNTTAQQTVTFTITPVANGCSGAPVTATVIVNAAPLITCPANITVNNTAGQCGAVVNYPAAVATGTPAPVVTYSIPSGSTFPVGVTTVTATATNACGTASCSFTVTVVDAQAPVITCPANISTTAVGACTAVVNYTVTATDNCSGVTVTRIAGPASGTAFPIGVTTVTHRATDAAGNSSTCSFTVTVTDGQLPVITAQPVSKTVCAGSNATFTVTATNAVSYQWQQWSGTAWSNITGATASGYTINSVTGSNSTNTVRVIVNGLCNTTTSTAATVWVSALPVVSISASGPTQMLPGQSISLTASPAPQGGTYTWYLNGSQIAGATAAVLSPVTVDQAGVYKVTYTDAGGCSITSANLEVSAMPSMNIYVVPNPNNGQFDVRVYNNANEELTLRIYNAAGGLVYSRKVAPAMPYSSLHVDLQAMGIPPAGVYNLVLFNKDGVKTGTRQIVVYR